MCNIDRGRSPIPVIGSTALPFVGAAALGVAELEAVAGSAGAEVAAVAGVAGVAASAEHLCNPRLLLRV